MEHFGIGFGHTFFGFMAAFSESIGGLLIALGLFFRPVCVLLCITMVVASGNHIATGRGSPAHSLKNAAFFLGFLLIGPGKYSLDYVIQQKLKGRTAE
jgi:putative oxidoreductase